MTVKIIQVLNNTTENLHYHNHESGLSFDLNAKSGKYENNNWIPGSDYHNDEVPNKDSSYIKITIGNKAPIKISYYKWKLSVVDYPDGDTREGVERLIGELEGDEKLVLRVDWLKVSDIQAALTVLPVDDALHRTDAGYVASSSLLSLGSIVGNAIVAIKF